MFEEYEKHDCGGNIIDGKPHYIPLGDDVIVKITDQICDKCGAVIIGNNQKKEFYHNKKLHDKLVDFLEEKLG
jgi:hypothetical protein